MIRPGFLFLTDLGEKICSGKMYLGKKIWKSAVGKVQLGKACSEKPRAANLTSLFSYPKDCYFNFTDAKMKLR